MKEKFCHEYYDSTHNLSLFNCKTIDAFVNIPKTGPTLKLSINFFFIWTQNSTDIQEIRK